MPHRLLADLLDLVLPADCAGCAAPAAAWCPRCAASAGPARVVGPLPGTPTTVAAGTYAGPLRQGLLAWKERGRRELLGPFADLVAGAAGLFRPARDAPARGAHATGGPARGAPIRPAPGRCWLVPVPSRPGAARARGGDHVRALADAVAERWAAEGTSVGVAAAVRMRAGGRDSVGLDAAARSANLRGRLLTRPGQLPPSGVTVLLIDDVVTTGATIRGCARALAAAGVIIDGALTLCDANRPARSPTLVSGPTDGVNYTTLPGGSRSGKAC